MAERIRLHDKTFELCISTEEIMQSVLKMAVQLDNDYRDLTTPVFLSVLNGSLYFTADLTRKMKTACELSCIRISSYSGTKSLGKVRDLIGIDVEMIKNRHLIIVEDIIDSGLTLSYLLEKLKELNPESVKVASLLFKRKALKYSIVPDYSAFEVENDFLVGYGLDYDGLGRNLNAIYKEVNVQ
jgi:hypoxanthine phosphoribosyltransferase